MQFTIIPLTEAYFEQMRLVLDFVAKEHSYLSFTEAPPPEEAHAFYQAAIDHEYVFLIAVADDQVVGWCDVQPRYGQARAHVGLMGVGLLPHVRGQGIGTRLIREAIAKAVAKGILRIELVVRVDNRPAIKLYEKIGFVSEGVMKQAMKVDGQYHDMYSMALIV